MQRVRFDDVEVIIERSDQDGVVVVHVDTDDVLHASNEAGPILRVWLNDDALYANPDTPGVS